MFVRRVFNVCMCVLLWACVCMCARERVFMCVDLRLRV